MPTITPSVCVFCGSRNGDKPAYVQAAREVGTMLAAKGWRLVYGAGDVGLMGEVARAAQSAGADTFGVIPEHLMDMEVGKRDLTKLVITQDMHERKKTMFMNADAIVTLPGGAGSMDEFFEVMTWRHLGLHEKPIYLVNIDGYWDPLITLIDHMIVSGFADESFRGFMTVVNDIPTLTTALQANFS